MPSITISGQVIDFPDSGESPNWAPAMIEFAEAVESALAGVAGQFDVPPQVLNIDAFNVVTNQSITALQFSTSDVRSFIVSYAIYRSGETPTTVVAEAGEFTAVYNDSNGSGEKWSIARDSAGDDARVTFTVTDVGQVQFSTTAVGTVNHTGTISFSAKAILQND